VPGYPDRQNIVAHPPFFVKAPLLAAKLPPRQIM
jgi:hypothetical protein